ncbi:peptidoglycan-associated lipoprotein Pal [Phenylobacterium montanum]|uniref:Peptidoglycan-associated lipoprotein n=1 Tax=Phenylobacterium montanum TaxID=2823693 RepID=A0A975G2U1_9CAUL|nr:peptidoglycan-associated lipoprotein Pal [Caulobacter sp. S6]QUD89527.1 peptidoglycan-associated lipoprotein Pal [Caulobacter sp. S6]
MSPTATRVARSLKPALILCATALLSACASHPKPAPEPAPHAPPPPPPPAATPVAPPPAAPVRTGPLPGTIQDFVVNAGDRVYFDLDQYNLRSDALPVLTAQVAWLNRYPAVKVRIEGNCDDRGTREYNFALGGRRAEAVKTFLVEHGVSASRITTVSYGKERPIDPGTGEEAWQHNRNGHTAITEGAQ